MDKSPDAFRTISEVAELLETPAHVLRFWESRFPQIKPVKRAGGRRYYRPADLALLAGIRRLLHDEGLTIRGVQKILREQGVKHVSGLAEDDVSDDADMAIAEDDGVEAPLAASVPIPLFPNARVPEVVAEDDADPSTSDLSPDAPAVAPPAPADRMPERAAPIEAAAEDGIDEDALRAALQDPETDALAKELPAKASVEETPEVAVQPPGSAASRSAPPAIEHADLFADDVPHATPDDAPEELSKDNLFATQAVDSESAAAKAPAKDTADVAPPIAPKDAQDVEGGEKPLAAEASKPVPTTPPGPMPPMSEITGHWLAADLRSLRADGFGPRRPQATALFKRLEALRNRVGDLGRVPRR